MDSNANVPASGLTTAGVNLDGERPTRADSLSNRDPSRTVGLIPSVASTEGGDPTSTVERLADHDDGPTQLAAGSTLDAEDTANWDSQATMPSWVESTLGAWRSTSAIDDASHCGTVPGFEIVEKLGRGGMGVVFKARHQRLDRYVALKMIRDDWLRSPEHLARFETEALALARLHHPNIVTIYETGRTEGVPYVVLELLEGGSLKEKLAGKPQPFREAAALLSTLARGVSAAHARGILHRDLKPSNILFDQSGIAKITDFGLAKRLDVPDGQTITGQLLGTPSYLAPEQAGGWKGKIGPTADIYSLGAILYELLTGRPPLQGATVVETLKLVQEEDPVPPSRLRSRLPFDLETICLKCLARDPRKRYPDSLSLAEDLDRYLSDESILARRTPLWERGIKRARKRPVTTVLVGVGILGAVILAGAIFRARTQERALEMKDYDRVTALVQQADQGLIEGERAFAKSQYEDVRVIVSRVLSLLAADSEPRVARRRDHAERLNVQARAGLKELAANVDARDRHRRFGELLDEALFLDTTRFADGLGQSVEATARAARDALGVFGVAATGDDWTFAPLPAAISAKDRDDVRRGIYQLLLILADAVAQSPDAAPARRPDAAMRIVDRAESLLGQTTRSIHLRRSDFLEMKGDTKAAASERASAEKCPPADALDLFLMARESIRRSDWPEAMAQLTAAMQHESDRFWVRCLLAIAYFQNKEPEKAWFFFSTCIASKPDQPWLYMLQGLANTAIGQKTFDKASPGPVTSAADQFKSAEDDYNRAFERLGDKSKRAELYYLILVNRGMMWLERDEPASAIADFRQAITLAPQRYEAFVDLGQAYQLQDRIEEALAAFAKAIERKPSWAPLYRARAGALLGVKDLTPELRKMTVTDLEEAIRNVSPERREAAARDLERAIQDELPDRHVTAADQTTIAALLREAGRDKEALDRCDEALEIAAKYPRAHELRIKVLLDLKRYDELLESCNAILEWAKPTTKIYELRGIARNMTRDFTGAIGDFTRAFDLAVDADRPRLLCHRGRSFGANGAHQLALKDFDDAIRLAPENTDGYLGRGLTLARIGQYRDAELDAASASQEDDASPNFAFRLACIYGESAAAASAEPRQAGPRPERLIVRYQDLAVTWVRRALERTPAAERASFLSATIKPDPALQSIRRALLAMERQFADRPAIR